MDKVDSGHHHFALGAFDCFALNDHTANQPYGKLAANLSERQLRDALRRHGISTESTRIDYNVLLIDTGDRTVLVDSGSGHGGLLDNMQVAGFGPRDIDVVFLTHADQDHVGGLLDEQRNLRFPRARVVMWRGMWELWSSAAVLHELEGAPGVFIHHILPCIRDRVESVELEDDFLPGFRAVSARGHKPDHTALEVSSQAEKLLHVGDALVHPLHVLHPEWQSIWDRHPDETARTRRRLLGRAAAAEALIFGSHFALPGLGRVSPCGQVWRWIAVEES